MINGDAVIPRSILHIAPAPGRYGFSAAGMLILVASIARGDQLVLRDLTRISGVQISRFDEDGILLENGDRYGWDRIERGTVATDKQPAFDRSLRELGEPLFRIRKRLDAGDYRELENEAETLYPRYRSRQSPTAYVVCQSVMWARLASGRREAAVEPYLRCFTILRSHGDEVVDLPGKRRLRFDLQTGMSSELVPVWFSAKEAEQALPHVFQAVAEMPEPRPEGTRIYYATLALTIGRVEDARRVLDGIRGEEPALQQLREIVRAQLAIATGAAEAAADQLTERLEQYDAGTKPLAIYWLGTAQLRSKIPETQQRGLLRLMHLPAAYSKRYPELAAAALYRAAEFFSERRQTQPLAAVRQELLEQYGQTVHAARLRDQFPQNQEP